MRNNRLRNLPSGCVQLRFPCYRLSAHFCMVHPRRCRLSDSLQRYFCNKFLHEHYYTRSIRSTTLSIPTKASTTSNTKTFTSIYRYIRLIQSVPDFTIPYL